MKKLKFIALSGTTGVTENLYIYEYENDLIVVDCGVGFPEADMYGVDLVIPDFTYLLKNKHKVRGIFITHGHEDHIGALPFLLKEMTAPIYAAKLVAGFIEDKFADNKMKVPKVNVFDLESDTIQAGVFKVSPFRISHSVPDSAGFCIETPEGKMFHIPDYKFDWTPVDGKPFDIKRLSMLAKGGPVMSVSSDCLGSTSPGYTESEKKIESKIEEIAREATKAIYFTTISSNISRMQQALNVALRMGRKVLFVGRSIDRKAEIARRLGYLSYPDSLVINRKKANNIPHSKIMYIISGSYGQPGSALYRVSQGEHQNLTLEKGDTVIFSADPAPPGSRVHVDNVVDRLIEAGADVHYYDLQEDLHVSGHGSQEDIKMLLSILEPKYFVPIGGTIRHMRAYTKLIEGMGRNPKHVFELLPGDVVEFSQGNAHVAGHIPVKQVLVDGLGVGDVGQTILRDRQILSENGVVMVLIQLESDSRKLIGSPELISRGFVFGEDQRNLFKDAEVQIESMIVKHQHKDTRTIKVETADFLERYFFEETGRRPMILPFVVEV